MGEPSLTLAKRGFSLYKKYFRSLIVIVFPLFMMILVTVVLALVVPFSIIVSLPFIIVPFLYSAFVCTTQIIADKEVPFKSFYAFAFSIIIVLIRRLMHPFFTLFKMALISSLVTLFFTFIINGLAPYFFPSLQVVLDDLMVLSATNFTLEQMQQFVVDNALTLDPYFAFATISGTLAGFLFLIVEFGKKLPFVGIIEDFTAILPRLDAVASEVIKQNKRMINRLILKSQWPSLLALSIGFITLMSIGMIFHVSMIITILMALLGGVIALFPFMGHYLVVSALVYVQLKPLILKESQQQFNQFLKDIDSIEGLDDAAKDELKQKYRSPISDIDDKVDEEDSNK